MKRPLGAPATTTLSVREQRQLALATCEHELRALLDRSEATLQCELVLRLAADGTPRYQFAVTVAARPT